jgi:signal transduction histidine kinase
VPNLASTIASDQSEAVARPRQPSVRARIAALFLASLLPTVVGFALLTYNSYHREQAQLERDTVQTARALTLAVDRDLGRVMSSALALATSPYLRQHDLVAFYAQGKSLLGNGFPGANFVLSDESGQQVVNTLVPQGAPLPRHGNPDQLRQIFTTGKPAISDLYTGGVTRRPVISIDVPVWHDGKVLYDLSAGIFPEQLGRILTEQRLPPDRIVAIYDTKGVIAARSHDPETFVGRMGAPAIIRLLQEKDEGFAQMVTLDNVPIYSSFSRSATTGWTVAIGIPRQTFITDLLQSLANIFFVVFGLLCVGFSAAWVLGGRIGESVRTLTVPALALGEGRPVSLPPMYFREADEVSASLLNAEKLIRQRTVERDVAVTAEKERSESEHRLADLNRELDAAAHKLAQSNAELEQFAYAASHDMREPLRMISSYLGLLERRCDTGLDQDGHAFLTFAKDGATRLDRMILGLLEYSRIGRGPQPKESMPLSEILEQAISNLGVAIETAQARVDIPAPLPTIVGNRDELVRLLQNLIANAVKYRSPDRLPVVTVTAGREDAFWRISVADNGIGIAPENRDRIFGIFQRLHGVDIEGSGIGLASCKKIVEHHGGRIWVEGEPGEGCAIVLTLAATE